MTARPAPTSRGGGTGGHALPKVSSGPGLDHFRAAPTADDQRGAQSAQNDGKRRASRDLHGARESATEGSASDRVLGAASAAASGGAIFEHTFGTGAGDDIASSTPVVREAGAPVPGGGGGAPPAPNPAPGAGPTPRSPSRATSAAALELLERFAGEQPALARLAELTADPRLPLLAAGWLAGFRSPRTRRAYAGDLTAFSAWCAERRLSVLGARRVQVDLHVTGLLDAGAAASSVARRLSALSSFYGFCLAEDLPDGLVTSDPTRGVRRPGIDRDHTTTVGLSREEARALITAADTDPGPQHLRTAALIRLLLHNALRVDEALAADLTGLAGPSGSSPAPESSGLNPVNGAGARSLTVVRKGGRRATAALAPDTAAALDRYLEARAQLAGATIAKLRATRAPLIATRTGGRLTQKDAWVLVRRLARVAGITSWAELSPHSLRHTAITLALDAGATLRDVQDYAGHRDPRTTRRYDHHRGALERSAAFAVADWLSPRPLLD